MFGLRRRLECGGRLLWHLTWQGISLSGRPWVGHTFVHNSALTGVSGRCGANHPEFSLSSMSLFPLQQGLCPNGSQAQRQLTQVFYASVP